MLSKNFSKAVRTAALATLALLLASASQAQTPASAVLSRSDQLVLDMNQAFARNDKARLSAMLPQVRGHTLEAWAAYWELRARLDEASVSEVQAFFTRYAGSYQEDRLRNDWLLLLGQRRDWSNFAAEHPNYRMSDDREVKCYALLIEHLKSPSLRLADELRKTWYAQREADDGCRLAADRFLDARQFTALDIWRKARLAAEANRTRPARDAVEIVAPDGLKLLAQLQASPAQFLADKKLALRTVRKELITLALIRLAATGTDYQAAAELMDKKWGFQLKAEERNWVWGVIGRQAAGRLDNAALSYFAKVSNDADLTDEMLGWKARAALRAGAEPQWGLVLSAVNAMSEDARREPTWLYWKGKALLATLPAAASTPAPAGATAAQAIHPQRAQALALMQSIASLRGFYEQLALEELGEKITLPARPAALTAEEKEGARLNPSLTRALYAIGMGLRPEGVREWNYGVNLARTGGLAERDLLAAAQLACDRAVWDRCINTSERTRTELDLAQRFPMPFRDQVLKRSRDIGLDPSYVYGLIRQESRFVMDARSHVGASGLMQIMPATARETARYIGLTSFTADQITQHDTNIVIGTAYLKRALDDFGGSMAMAAAAYNAGPSRPRSWRNGPVLDGAIWAENVPFAETRDYVKKVLSNATVYAALISGQPQSLKARLGMIGPREAVAGPVDDKMP